jgi:hypothetical protein
VTKPKRHHYLPQFYLEGFADEKRIWIFDRETQRFRRDSPLNTAVIGHYYDVTDSDGKVRTEVETFLSQIEGSAKEIIRKLDSREMISRAEKKALADFVGFLFGRVPQFERTMEQLGDQLAKTVLKVQFEDPERAQKAMDLVKEKTGEEVALSAEQMVEFIQRGEYTVSFGRASSLRAMLQIGEKTARLIERMNWFVAHAAEGEWCITTDAPFTVLPPADHDPHAFGGVGIATPGAWKFIPLTRRTTLVIGDGGPVIAEHLDVPVGGMLQQNVAIAADCDRLVIGPHESLVREVVREAELEGTKAGPRMRTDW